MAIAATAIAMAAVNPHTVFVSLVAESGQCTMLPMNLCSGHMNLKAWWFVLSRKDWSGTQKMSLTSSLAVKVTSRVLSVHTTGVTAKRVLLVGLPP